MQFKHQFVENADGLYRPQKGKPVSYVQRRHPRVGWFIKLPKSIPLSKIIVDSAGCYQKQVNALYAKYLDSGTAEFEINVAYEGRQKFMINLKIINEVFDSARATIKESDKSSANVVAVEVVEVKKKIEVEKKEETKEEKEEKKCDDNQPKEDEVSLKYNVNDNNPPLSVDMQLKLLTIFDELLVDVEQNLRDAFFRFRARGGLDIQEALMYIKPK